MSDTCGAGQTIKYGFCPGCKTLHRMTGCPDSDPKNAEYCICCEAITAEVVRTRAAIALYAPSAAEQGGAGVVGPGARRTTEGERQ